MTLNSPQDVRLRRQDEAAKSFVRQGIIKAAPRFGKIKTSINILKRENPEKILISFPRTEIQTGWLNDFEKWGYRPKNITFTTFKSLSKYTSEDFDFFIVDEIHEASRNQLNEIGKIARRRIKTLALSGTITQKTEKQIFTYADLALCYDYSIEKAVEEGILADYHIFVHKVPLSIKTSSKYTDKNKNLISEKKKFDSYMYVMNGMKKSSQSYFNLEVKAIAVLQNSEAKRMKTLHLLEQFVDDRVLVFCGTTEIADNLGIPAYHSKAKEKGLFDDFCSGKGKHMATIKMAQSGVTILPINKGLLNYTSGNPEDTAQKICRFLGMEYDTPDKKAEIHLVVANEPFELFRIKTGLQFFDEKKITYVENKQ